MSHRTLPSARRLAIALVAMLLAGSLAAPAVANTFQPDGNRSYRAAVSPDECVAPFGWTTFTVQLRNTSNQQQLGSADITPGFPVREPSEVVVTAWEGTQRTLAAPAVSRDGTTLHLRNLGAAPGSVVEVSFQGSPAPTTFPATYVLANGTNLIVKQANNFQGPPGNNLALVGDAPEISVADDCWLGSFDLDPATLDTGTCDPADPLCEGTSALPSGFTAQASGLALNGPGALLVATTLVDQVGQPGCEEPTLPGNRRVHRLRGGEGQLAETTLIGFGLEQKLVTFTVPRELDQSETNNGVAQYEICAKPIEPYSSYSFFQDTYTGNWVLGDVDPDSVAGVEPPFQTWGWLPDCSDPDQRPCVESRDKVGGSPVIAARWGSGIRLK